MEFARKVGLQIKLEVHEKHVVARNLYDKYGFKYLGDYDIFIVRNIFKSLRKQILNLAYPAIISNITVPLVGLVDIALVGRLGSADYIGGVGFASVVFSFIYSGLGFLRMSTIDSQHKPMESSNFREANSILIRAIILGVLSGLLLIALQTPLERLLISMLILRQNLKICF